jgi:predicted ArsR family transcriptional regulator
MIQLTGAKRRLVERLKRVESASAGELAAEFGLTDTAVRQHLEALQRLGLVRRIPASASITPAAGRGRPASRWQLTIESGAAFADRHADLTVDLLQSIRTSLGEHAVDEVLAARAARQTEQYRRAVGQGSVGVKVRRLAEQRTTEGYDAEVRADGDALVLVEHHCPICVAATTCQSLCRSELEVFRATLGENVHVEREQHLLSGDQRCAYRITTRR